MSAGQFGQISASISGVHVAISLARANSPRQLPESCNVISFAQSSESRGSQRSGVRRRSTYSGGQAPLCVSR